MNSEMPADRRVRTSVKERIGQDSGKAVAVMNGKKDDEKRNLFDSMERSVEGEIPSEACKREIYSRILKLQKECSRRNQQKIRMNNSDKKLSGDNQMKKWSLPKVAAATALCFLLGGGAVLAAGKISGSIVSIRASGDYWGYRDLGKAEEQAGLQFYAPEFFSNGYAMESISLTDISDVDADGQKRNPRKGMTLVYQKDTGKNQNVAKINLDVSGVQDSSEDSTQEICEDSREVDGVTLYYMEAEYLFVPPDYEPTKEEKEREQSDPNFHISYGSDEKQTSIYRGVSFQKDGLQYTLFGMDTGLTGQELLDMAEEIVRETE